MRRSHLREREARKILEEFALKLPISFEFSELKSSIELAEVAGYEIFYSHGKPIFAKFRKRLFPTLTNEELINRLPKAIVDMGAVAHVCNGADIMAPGITRFQGTFQEEDTVVVADERHRRPLAVAFSLFDVVEARKTKEGKILVNLHYVGDKLWTLTKTER